MPTKPAKPLTRVFVSLGILLAGLGLAYAPLPGLTQTIIVVSGTELEDSLQVLVPEFQRQHPDIELDLKFQGSQDMVNRYLDDRNDFQPDVLIPADAQFLQDLKDRWQTQHSSEAFVAPPQAIAKTSLVAIAWPERGKQLFPQGKFSWNRIETAMQGRSWASVGGKPDWGSFDFVMTDPTRSNSGLLTLALWSEAVGGKLSPSQLSDPKLIALFRLVKQSVYQPPRSSDILLKEFMARGANEADVGITYESIALYRWLQANSSQQPYQIYYLDRTVETTPTAAIVGRHNNMPHTAAAQKFIDFLVQPIGQTVLAQHGFRPVNPKMSLGDIPNTPWKQAVPGAQLKPTSQVLPSPSQPILEEIQRQWERAQ